MNDMQEMEAFFSRKLRTLTPFESILIEFCDTLSKALFAHPEIASFPDITALAFWLRRSHLEGLRAIFLNLAGKGLTLVPRGTVFHIAPANVETMFVYSWILSLLVGNANIVRLPTKGEEGLALLFEEIRNVLDLSRFKNIQDTTCFISYGHEEEVTASVSAKADVRMIWGGDETIRTIRKIPLKVTGKEIVFADRYAFSALNAEALLAADEQERKDFINNLYNDVFWYDQNACSSPRALFWIGSADQIKKAGEEVYKLLKKHIWEKGTFCR